MAYQTRPQEVTLYLTLSNVPAVGITYSVVTVQYRKYGQTTFQTKTMTSPDWVPLGNGFYVLKFSGVEMDTLGDFFFKITGGAFDMVREEFEVIPIPSEIVTTPPDICNVTGQIRDVGGNVPRNVKITARPVVFPNEAGVALIIGDEVTAELDSQGLFSLPLIRNQVVVVEIGRTGIKNQITVPDAASALLQDLMPSYVG